MRGIKFSEGELYGLMAGTLTTGSFLPQVYDVWRKGAKPTPDISLAFCLILFLGVGLWILYGTKIRSLSVIWFNVVTLALAASLVVHKILYG